MAYLGAQVHLQADDDVDRIAAENLSEERVPALLEVGQEDRVINVAKGVRVAPPDVDRMLEYGGHVLAPSLALVH